MRVLRRWFMRLRYEVQQWMTFGLLGTLVVVWVAMTVSGRSLEATRSIERLEAWGAVVRPDLWLTGQYWRLLTAAFLHIGYEHLLINGFSLWSVGRIVEWTYGSGRMLYIFLISGVAGSVASCLFGPPIVLTAGASGAIFGLLGAVIWFRISSPLGERIAWPPLLWTLGLNLGFGLMLHRYIDNWNHLGGLIGGMIAAFAIGVPAVATRPWPRFRLPPAPQVAVALALLVGVCAVVTGYVELPGSGRDLARVLTFYEQHRCREALTALDQLYAAEADDPDLQALRREVMQCR